MVFTIESKRIERSGKRVYSCKDAFGKYAAFTADAVKDMMTQGDVFRGLRIAKSGRLIANASKQNVVQLKSAPISVNMNGYRIFTGRSLIAHVDPWVRGKKPRYAVGTMVV